MVAEYKRRNERRRCTWCGNLHWPEKLKEGVCIQDCYEMKQNYLNWCKSTNRIPISKEVPNEEESR